MRSKMALINYFSTLLLEFASIVVGFVLPRLFIKQYGPEAYGLTTSISHFMGYLTLLQSGVGGVIRAALYKPLAHNDINALSRIVKSTDEFFKKISGITLLYVLVLVSVFGFLNNEFDFLYTSSMIVIISIGSLFQYYFGITYQMLLEADQKNYIYSLLQLLCTIVNVLVLFVVINLGVSIHLAKLISSIVFAVRPVIINLYVKNRYQLNLHCEKDNTVIAQRWDGFGQTVAYFVHTKTDVFLITVLMDLTSVSVYSLYALVNTGLNTFISAFAKAIQPAFGNMIAKDELKALNERFYVFVTLIHGMSTVMFSTAIIMVVPFIKVYTKAFNDNEVYVMPTFAILILLAECMYCYRLPYHTLVNAAGHYRQTRRGAYIEAILNLCISIVLIKRMGMTGVAIGTLVAMVYRICDYVFYLKENIITLPVSMFLKHMIANAMVILAVIPLAVKMINLEMRNWAVWISYAFISFFGVLFFTLIVNAIFFKQDIRKIFVILNSLFHRKL